MADRELWRAYVSAAFQRRNRLRIGDGAGVGVHGADDHVAAVRGHHVDAEGLVDRGPDNVKIQPGAE